MLPFVQSDILRLDVPNTESVDEEGVRVLGSFAGPGAAASGLPEAIIARLKRSLSWARVASALVFQKLLS